MATAKNAKDVLDTRREFTIQVDDEEVSFYIAQPSGAAVRKSDWQYSKVYNQAIVDGFLTQAQMIDVLKEKGILSEEYAQRVESTRIGLASELFKLENLREDAPELECEGLALEVARLRDELFSLNQQVNGPLGNTCENLADDARNEYLTSRIVQHEDGSYLWEDFDAYQNEENSSLSVKARFEVMLWIQGLDSNFLENTPEQSALRAIAQARLTRAIESARAENAEGASSEEELELDVDVVEDVPKKKRAPRKKKTPVKSKEDKPAPKKRGRPKKTKTPVTKTPVEEEISKDD
jgi:ribosomal protein S20